MSSSTSISKSLSIWIGVAIMSVGLLTLGIYYFFQESKGTAALDRLSSEYANTIADSLSFSLWNLDSKSITQIAKGYASNTLVVRLSVKDSLGNLMFSYDNTREMEPDHNVSFVVNYEGSEVGSVEISLTDYFLRQQNRHVLIVGVFLILLSFASLFLMTKLLLTRFLREPLTDLKRVALEYSKGNYRNVVPANYYELLEFSRVLEEMGDTIELQMAKLRETEDELRKHKERLEEEVVRRTEELKQSKQRLETILKASPVGIGLVKDRCLHWANEAMYDMIGYEKGSLLKQSASILYPDLNEFERVGLEVYEGVAEKGYGIAETKWARKDGTVFDCTVRVYNLDKDDPSRGQIVAAMDTSEIRQLQLKLKRAEKMETIGTLAGGVAHDLNNILSGIVSYPELLLLDVPDDSPMKKSLEIVKKSGEKAVKIVQDLLTMTRRGVMVTEILDVNRVIQDQLQSPEMEKLLYYHPEVKIVSDFEENMLNIRGSEIHIAKSIMNLISNGAEAMPEGGTVTITTSSQHLDKPVKGYEQIEEGDYIRITVTDTGTGISENDIEKIFEPFYSKKTMGRSGTGLGMAVVWGTVKDHKGYIDVRSADGSGTTIIIYLPVTREELKLNSIGTSLEDVKGRGELVLIIDDVEEQRIVAGDLLQKLGYRVASAASGEEAVEYLKQNGADIVLLDMIMDPGIDGLETYRRIIEVVPGQKAVIASGYSRTERVEELQRLGAGGYVRKPYTIEKIGRALRGELETDKNGT